MSDSRVVLAEKNYSYKLYKDSSERYLFEVVVGSLAVFICMLELTAEEKDQFHEHGVWFLDRLAKDINYDHEKFRDRFLKVE